MNQVGNLLLTLLEVVDILRLKGTARSTDNMCLTTKNEKFDLHVGHFAK